MMTKRSAIVFLISFIGVFLMTILPRLGIRISTFNLPLTVPKIFHDDFWEKIKPKLEYKVTSWVLKKNPAPKSLNFENSDKVSGYSVVNLDTREVVSEKNLSQRLPIASLTKLMTAAVALDLAQPDEIFTVSRTAAAQIPTKVMLKEGEKFSLGELLDSMLISSANDSAQVVKEGIDSKYGAEVFIKAMNTKASILGLKNSHFASSQGFDSEDNYSSVEDLTILTRYVLSNYPLIAKIVARESEDLITNYKDKRFYLNNWNGLLGVYPGVSGVKVGNTKKSGNSTIVLAERDGKRLLAVLLGAPGVKERDLWTSQLLDAGFTQVAGLVPIHITEADLLKKYSSWKYLN